MDSLALDKFKSANDICYCVPPSIDYVPSFTEDECATNCIINYLGQQNADFLMLIENFLAKNTMFFSSTCLKALIAFLFNSHRTPAEKERVMRILRHQLEQDPSCAEYTFQTYQKLLLEPEEVHFEKLTLLDYLLSQLQNISSANVVFSANRVTRRTRRTVSYDEHEFTDLRNVGKVESLKGSHSSKDTIFVLLDMLTEILTHDLRTTLSRGESPTECILAKLIFKSSSSTLLFQPMVQKLFQAYKCCTSAEERRHVAKLLELAATLAWQVDEEQKEANGLRLGSCCGRFVSDFLIGVFDEEEIRESYSMDKITSLNLHWLRYHAAHFVLKKVSYFDKISKGIKGVLNKLCIVLAIPQNDRNHQSNDSPNQNFNSARIDEELIAACRTDDLESLKRLSEANIDLNNAFGSSGQSALHIAAQYGSVECVSFLLSDRRKILNIQSKDKEGITPLMYAECGGHTVIIDMLTSYADKISKRIQKLTPSLCKIFMIITDTMIKMLDTLDHSDRIGTVQCLEQLLSLIEDLCQVSDVVPKELVLWLIVLKKIKFVD